MAGRAYLYQVANQLDLASSGNGLDADGVKLYCAKMGKEVRPFPPYMSTHPPTHIFLLCA